MSPRRSKRVRNTGLKPVADNKTDELAGTTEYSPARNIFRSNFFIAAVLAVLFAAALFLRVYPSYDKVFSPVGIKFTSNDSYFFMRLVDNLVNNFPNFTSVDPYLIFPVNTGAVQINFFVWMLAIPAWIAGLGSPSQHLIDVTAAFFPAIMGALMVIPVYFIGKELFGRWAGALSAALIAIIPGEFLGRSILGFTDNHVAETFFTTIAMLFLILAIKSAHKAADGRLTLQHIMQRDWAVARKPLIYSLIAAVVMGLYMFTWLGALLFVFMVFVYFVIQFVIDHMKHKSTDYLCLVGVVFFGIALLTALLISSSRLYIMALLIATLAMPALNYFSRFLEKRKVNVVLYPLSLLAAGAVLVSLFYLIDRTLFSIAVDSLRIFKPSGTDLTTIEMQPIISKIYGNPLVIVWGNFNVSFFLSLISLAILLYLIIKEDSPEKSLLVVWSLVILVATLGQRRFGYYLAVNVTLLTGFLSWKIVDFYENRRISQFIALASIPVVCTLSFILKLNPPDDGLYLLYTLGAWIFSVIILISVLNKENTGAVRAARIGRVRIQNNPFNVYGSAVTVLALLLFSVGVLFWNSAPAKAVASNTPYAPSDAWVSSMDWLRENSPDPMGDPDAYYQRQSMQPGQSAYQYPSSAYGVLSWWDYGYWITRIAHRIPNANPSQDPVANRNVAQFFITQNESAAAEMRQNLGSKYVVIDYETTISKFWAIITWAGGQPSSYFDVFLVPQKLEGQTQVTYQRAVLFFPEYYRSMAVRLFNFDGKAAVPENVLVIDYREQKDTAGTAYKVISDYKQFATFDEAQTYITGNTTGKWKIIGTNPMKSAVPLEALTDYNLVHSSEQVSTLQEGITTPSVKIFEYVK